MMKRQSGFHVNPIDIRRPGKAANLCRQLDAVRRDGKFIRGCPDLADVGLVDSMY